MKIKHIAKRLGMQKGVLGLPRLMSMFVSLGVQTRPRRLKAATDSHAVGDQHGSQRLSVRELTAGCQVKEK